MSGRRHGDAAMRDHETGLDEPQQENAPEAARDDYRAIRALAGSLGNRSFTLLAKGRRTPAPAPIDVETADRILAERLLDLQGDWAGDPRTTRIPSLRRRVGEALAAHPTYRGLDDAERDRLVTETLLSFLAAAPPIDRSAGTGATPGDVQLDMNEIARAWTRNPREADLERLNLAVSASIALNPDLRSLGLNDDDRVRLTDTVVAEIVTRNPPKSDRESVRGGDTEGVRFPGATVELAGKGVDLVNDVDLKPLNRPQERRAFMEAVTKLAGTKPKPPPRHLGEFARSMQDLGDFLQLVIDATRLLDPKLAAKVNEFTKDRVPEIAMTVEMVRRLSSDVERIRVLARSSESITLWMRQGRERTDTSLVTIATVLLGQPGVDPDLKEALDRALAQHTETLHDVFRASTRMVIDMDDLKDT